MLNIFVLISQIPENLGEVDNKRDNKCYMKGDEV